MERPLLPQTVFHRKWIARRVRKSASIANGSVRAVRKAGSIANGTLKPEPVPRSIWNGTGFPDWNSRSIANGSPNPSWNSRSIANGSPNPSWNSRSIPNGSPKLHVSPGAPLPCETFFGPASGPKKALPPHFMPGTVAGRPQASRSHVGFFVGFFERWCSFRCRRPCCCADCSTVRYLHRACLLALEEDHE